MSAQLLAACVTPMADAGASVDEKAIPALVRFLLDRGVDGLFACGTTGEGFLLSTPERRRTAECFRAADEATLIVHCGAQSTAETVELASHAAGIGADGVAVIPPPYFALDELSLTEHFVAAADACAPVPFYLYAFTERSGYKLPVSVVERVRERSANVAGFKVSDGAFDDVEPFIRLGLPVYVGSEALIPRALQEGAAGSVSGLASAFPEAVSALVHTPNPDTAARVAALGAGVNTTAFIAALKHVLVMRGLPSVQDVRPPQRLLTDSEREVLERVVADEQGRWS